MPGYSVDRFPDLSAEDRDEYTCSICQQIFDTPVTTKCCLQTFCEDCINEWLETNTTCPYDRKRLSPRKLTPAPRVTVNTMGRFIIRCDYWDQGCRELVQLANLQTHTVNCSYNVTICTDCQTVMTSDHNCIESLRREIETLKVAMNDLDPNSNQQLPSANSTLSGNQIVVECRQHMSAPVMLINTMDTEMKDKTLTIIREMLVKHNIVSDVCKHAVDCMNLEFGTEWYCLAEGCAGTQPYLNLSKGVYMRVKFTPITFTLFHSKKFDWTNFKTRLERNKIVRKLDNIETDMNASMVSIVTGIVFDAIDRSDSIRKTAHDIEAKMESRYEGTSWACFLYDYGSYRLTYYGKYIKCNVDELNVTMYDTKRKIVNK